MASAGWPRPWEGSFKQFPELVVKEQKYFTDHARPSQSSMSQRSKLQTSKQAFCPSGNIPGALSGGRNHLPALEPHFQPDRRGISGSLSFCFASVRSQRGTWARRRSQARRLQGATSPVV